MASLGRSGRIHSAEAFLERTLVLILAIGEILFDIFPDGRRLGGAAFNFAFHLHCLDGPVRFLSRIGIDADGRAVLDFLRVHEFPVDDLQTDPEHSTGRVQVTVDARGGPQFDILPGVAYDFIVPTPSLDQFVAGDCRLIYFGSLIQRTPAAARTVSRLLGRRSAETKCLFDINLRPGCFNADSLDHSLRAADILKLNEDELADLTAMLTIKESGAAAVEVLMGRYAIEMVALTRAERGSSLFQGHTRHDIQPDRDVPIKDTVGAGDAFAAMLAIGYLHQWPPGRILAVAQSLATAICGIPGAVPETPEFYAPIRAIMATGGNHD